jgi:hypothetical protein
MLSLNKRATPGVSDGHFRDDLAAIMPNQRNGEQGGPAARVALQPSFNYVICDKCEERGR